MLSFILAAATPTVEAHSAHAAEAGLVQELVTKFGIDAVNIGMQLASFTILAVVLYKFAIKPVLATMDQRTSKIESGLKFAEDMKSQLAAAQQESAALIKAAQLESNKIIEETRKTAKDFSDKSQAEATERANGLITKAQQAIELEHKKMLADARSEIARLVVATTERVLAKKLTDADRASYNETAARELANV
ncbi:ATP synthase F0 subunit B [Nibricoccus aquaticus]|uniref:ATP synthase subunit b n=1 Tax=Nibricoccus aquaticus TaxID=2576891 RepID=A0A290Q6A7_9BACT|nr:F0F1 ATP synthase subunit B [Nibricoccus aquaticus]ATC64024.1 ATP synthase F0 subunit B [Nibricoccus aquaticus]